MARIKLRTPGKINWTLEVLGKREDGYHDVRMLMQSVSLFDYIGLSSKKEGISIVSNSKDIPLDQANIAYKAADLLLSHCNIRAGVKIDIEKHIPIAAGMAGGSTDAAAVLVGLNKLWSLGLSLNELEVLGKEIGADVPFCIRGGTALAEGIGDRLSQLPPIKDVWLLLVKPPFSLSTARVYGGIDMDKVDKNINAMAVYDQLTSGSFKGSRLVGLANDLEGVSIGLYPEIQEIKRDLIGYGACASMMTGSGPTVYGVFANKEKATEAMAKMKGRYSQVYLARTWDRGPEIISLEGGVFDQD